GAAPGDAFAGNSWTDFTPSRQEGNERQSLSASNTSSGRRLIRTVRVARCDLGSIAPMTTTTRTSPAKTATKMTADFFKAGSTSTDVPESQTSAYSFSRPACGPRRRGPQAGRLNGIASALRVRN